MRVRLLGRPAITGPDGPVELRGPRQAGLLALLGTEAGRVVRRSRIEDELWDGQRVSGSAVRVNVNRLRARFLNLTGTDPIGSHTLGYSLELGADEIDIHRFVIDARAAIALRCDGQAARAVEHANAAERWWRGPAFEGVADLESVRPERDRLEALRCDVWQERAIALIELGQLDDALGQLDVLLDAAPYRETAWGLRLVALGRSGRRDEASARYRQLTDLLDRELGIAPDPAIAALADAIRAGDRDPAAARSLLVPASPSTGGSTRPRTDDHPSEHPERVARADARRRRDHEQGPFVGRAALLDELASLMLAPDESGSQPGSITVVEGAAGIGKTRLADEVATRLIAQGGLALVGTCPREGGSAMAPIADVVAGALAHLPAGADDDLEALAALVPGWVTGTGSTTDPDPEIRRLQLFDAATQALERAREVPLLVVIDDVQWVSTDAARFLHHLIQRTGAHWLLLARPGERTPAASELLADVARWRPAWRTLDPLDPTDVAELVGAIAPAAPAAVGRVVADRCGGNPFFATELARHLAAGGDAGAVPRGVEQLVLATLDGLGESARRVAEVLAVAGEPMAIGVLGGATGLDPDAVDHALVVLSAVSVGARSTGDARLAHDLVTETVGATIGLGRRATLHLAIGRALLAAPEDRQAMALSHLLVCAPDVPADELDRAASITLRRLIAAASYHEAIRVGSEYLDVASGGPSRAGLDARVQLASAQLVAGSYGRGVALLDRIAPDVRRLGDASLSADAILARGTVNVASPDLVVQVDEARMVLSAIDRSQAGRRVQLACWIAHHLALLGRTREALDLADLAEDENRFEADPNLRALVLGVRMQLASGVETPPAATSAVYAEVCALADEEPGVTSDSWRRLFALDQTLRDGTLDQHTRATDDLATILERFPRPDLRWAVQAARAGNALARGDLDRAEELILAAQITGGELSIGSAPSVWIVQRFVLQLERGDLSTMTPFLSALDEGSSSYQYAARALLHIESGDLALVRTMAGELAGRTRVLAAAGAGWTTLASQLGDIAFAAGDQTLAENLIGELDPHRGTALSAHGFLHLGASDRCLGLAWATLGELDRAIDHLDQAHADDRRRGAPTWAARAARSAAASRRQRRRRGDLTAARVLDQEAGRLLER